MKVAKCLTLVAVVPVWMCWSLPVSAATVEFAPTPNPPEPGENQLQMKITDEAGRPVDGMTVDLLVFMPAMGAMPRMEERAEVVPKGSGIYAASFELPMGGTWELAATAARDGKSEAFHATLTTGIPGVAVQGVAANRTGGDAPLINVGPERLQMIGVRFAEAKMMALTRDVEAVGVVEQDQTHREEVTLRVSGYMVKQIRGRVGDPVKAGDPLFTVYSPDFVTAQSEFFLADSLTGGGATLRQAATDKLKNLGLSPVDIDQIRRAGKPNREITIRSKINGTILEINTREGAAVIAGQVVYTIGDLSRSFVVARVFQQDVGVVKAGQAAAVSIPGVDTKPVPAKVNLVYSGVEQGAGTANVRIEVDEANSASLRPGAFVDVRVPVDLGTVLAIPTEAVLYSGKHHYVFVDRGNGSLEPREVNLGRSSQGLTEVREGLVAGDRVAASGTFLLGSEAQLRSALPKWRADTEGEATK